MTSNIGSEEFNSQAEKIGFATSTSDEAKIVKDYANIKEKVLKQLPEFFAPEFLNRIDKTIVFSPLDKKVMRTIISLQLDELIARLADLQITCTYDTTKVITHILDATYNPEYGARPVRRYIQDAIEDALAEEMVTHRSKKTVHIGVLQKKMTFSWK